MSKSRTGPPWTRRVAVTLAVSLLAAGMTLTGAQPATAAGCDTATYGGDVTGLATTDTGATLQINGRDVCQVWFTSGTNRSWTLPPVSSIDVAVVGGGGGGGGAAAGTGGAGGGGGAVVVRSSLSITPGGAATITIGAGGTAGQATPTAGGNGGTTTAVISGTTLTANGGTGGAVSNGTGGSSSSTVGSGATVTYSGGTGLGTTIGGGGGAGAGRNGYNAILPPGVGVVDQKRVSSSSAATGMGGDGLTVNTTLFKKYSTSTSFYPGDIILGGGGDGGAGTANPRVGYAQRYMVFADVSQGTGYYDWNSRLSIPAWGAPGGGGVQHVSYLAGANGLGGGGVGGSRAQGGPGVGGAGGSGGVLVRFVMPDPPGVPTITTSTPTGSGSAGVVNLAITNGGGTVPTSYVVQYRLNGTTNWTTLTPNPTTSPVSVSGLAAGLYNFRVASQNMVGVSAYSAIVNGTALGVTRPGAPTTLSGDAKVTASVVLSTTGAIPTSYVIQAYQNNVLQAGKTCTVTPPATSCQVTGLTNGTAYTFTTTAYNGATASQESPQSVATTPFTVPGAPTSLTAAPLDGAMDIAFTAPASNGGASIVNYQYSTNGGVSWTPLSPADAVSPVRIPGLVNGQSYSVRLRAVNAAGVGAASSPAGGTPKAAGPPDAPTGLIATARPQSAQIAFTAGANNGSAITDYQYSLDSGVTWASLSDSTSPVTIPNLMNDTAYSIQLRAVNALGEGPASQAVTVTPRAQAPSAPTGLVAIAQDRQTTISFTPPASDGGGTITNYQYSLDGGVTWTALSPADGVSPVTVPNLVNGTPYAIRLRAVNSSGPGAVSAAVSVTPVGRPDSPTGLVATAGNASAQIAFTPGASNGSAILNYEFSTDSGSTWTALSPADSASPVNIPGLTNSTPVTIALRAVNAIGVSDWSDPVTVTPVPLPPSAPTITSAARGNGQATITFTAPTSDGGGTITDYEYSVDGGVTWTSRSGTSSPFTVTGLTNGTEYSFLLRAKNASGPGAASAPATVTPATVPGAPGWVTSMPLDGAVTLSFTPGSDNGSPITNYEYRLLPNGPWTALSPVDTSSPVTIPNLQNGIGYQIDLRAVNDVGPSLGWDGVNVWQVAAGLPGAPTGLTATPGTSQASITFNPGGDGGTPIQNYQYSLDGGATWIALSPVDASSPVVITGLDDTTPATYTVRLRGVNVVGAGATSDPVSVTITSRLSDTVPDAPTNLVATPSDRSASIAFTAGANGGQAITNYQYSLDDGATWRAFNAAQTTSPVSISGLDNGTTYPVRLRAVNSVGPGAVSAPVSITPAVVPAAPTNLVATALSGAAEIDFTPGYNGGVAITNYKYSLDNGGTWTSLGSTTSPVTIPNLTNNTAYTIRLRAVNAIGDGAISSSVTVTPKALPPSAPTGLVATAGNGQASIAFTAPASDGGGTITNYQYSLDGGVTWTALSPVDSTSPVTIPNLANGTTYTVALRAVNVTGPGAASSAVSVTPIGPPDAPVSLVAIAENGSAQVAFTPGADNGSAITNYKYSLDNGGTWISLGSATSPVTIANLTNLTAYTIRLRAVNALGDSVDSASVTVTPQPLPPSAPTALVATAGDRQVSIAFTAPVSDGGGAITNYQFSVDGGTTWTALSPADATSPVTIPNLANGTPYTVMLRAVNATGPGQESASSSPVTPAGPPGSPTNLVATSKDGAAEIAFTAGASNGTPITNYQYSLDGGTTWTALSPLDDSSPVTVPGLTNGTPYTITLRSVNGAGVSDPSATSASVIPTGPPSKPTNLVSTPLDDAGEIAFTPPTSDGGGVITNYQYSLDGGTTWISLYPVDGASPIMVPNLTNGVQSTIILRAVNAGGVGAASDPVTVTPAAAPAPPTALVASPENSQATVTFTPGPDNGSAITEYLYSLDGGAQWTAVSATSSPVTVPGLVNGTAYTIKLRARNSVGVGTISQPVSVTPGVPAPPPGPPGPAPTQNPPRDVRAVAGDGQATVTWQAPVAIVGLTVTDYEVTSSPGGKTCLVKAPTLSCTVTGLANGTAYTFTVKALSGAGWSAASAPSNAVTPSSSSPSPQPQPLPAPLAAGESQLHIDGTPSPDVAVKPNTTENGLDVSGDGWTMTLDGLGPDGRRLNLGPDGVLILDAERDVQTSGTGFKAGSRVAVYLDPPVLAQQGATRSWLRDLIARAVESTLLGTFTVESDGTYAGTATLPTGLDPGNHVVQAVGEGTSGQMRALSIGVVVRPWITLDKGQRKAAGVHDRITARGDSAGITAGSRLTPVIRYQGQSTTSKGKAVITVAADGTFRWTRQIRKDKGLTAYVTWTDVASNRVYWAKVR